MGGNEEYKYKFYTLTLNSLSVTDTTPPRKQTNVAFSRSFIVSIFTIEQKMDNTLRYELNLYKKMYEFL